LAGGLERGDWPSHVEKDETIEQETAYTDHLVSENDEFTSFEALS
jgi:hypothetical protein